MRVLFIAVLGGAFVAGCASPAEQAARAQQEVDRMLLVYGPACEKLGFKGNTDSWRNCIIGLSQKDESYRYSGSVFFRGYDY